MTDMSNSNVNTAINIEFLLSESLSGASCTAVLTSTTSIDYSYPADLPFSCALDSTNDKLITLSYIDLVAQQTGTQEDWDANTIYAFTVVI